MTKNQMVHLNNLETMQDKARFLLTLKITTRINIINLDPVLQACIGDIGLPIVGNDEKVVIDDAVAWLKEKAEMEAA